MLVTVGSVIVAVNVIVNCPPRLLKAPSGVASITNDAMHVGYLSILVPAKVIVAYSLNFSGSPKKQSYHHW